MVGMVLVLETEKGYNYNLDINGDSTTTVVMKAGYKLRKFVNKIEKKLKNTEDKIKHKKVIFNGSWSFPSLKMITDSLDKSEIEWWLDP